MDRKNCARSVAGAAGLAAISGLSPPARSRVEDEPCRPRWTSVPPALAARRARASLASWLRRSGRAWAVLTAETASAAAAAARRKPDIVLSPTVVSEDYWRGGGASMGKAALLRAG